jgi:hypothetical protein
LAIKSFLEAVVIIEILRDSQLGDKAEAFGSSVAILDVQRLHERKTRAPNQFTAKDRRPERYQRFCNESVSP